ncbi:hypothetical protein H8D57_01285 [bacterium]|nr:hypothetical protein [bacterium]
MTPETPFQTFFDKHAEVYDENGFASNTLFEVDFLIEELKLAPGAASTFKKCYKQGKKGKAKFDSKMTLNVGK